MKPSDVIRATLVAVKANEPVFLWGAPGIGKSDIGKTVARMYAEETPTLAHKLTQCESPDDLVKDVRLLLRSIVHLMGLPDLDKTDGIGRTYFTRPADIPHESEPIVILMLEELNLAVPSVQAAAYQLVLDRRIGDYALPKYVRIIATGNRKKDRGATHDMPVPLRDRFALHITVEPDRDDWINWAASHGIRPELIAWARWQGHLLHVAPGDKVAVGSGEVTFDRDANAFPTPRRYAKLSRLMDAGIPGDLETEMIAACIGEPIAMQFAGFVKIFRQLPNPANIAMNPDKVQVPTETATRWALASALVSHVTEQNGKNMLSYLSRFQDSSNTVTQKEYAIFFVKAAAAKDPEIQNTAWFNTFIAQNSDIIF